MTEYAPEAPPITIDPELQDYLARELARVGDSVRRVNEVVMAAINVAPTKPEEGAIIYADGVNFNPNGEGEGFYGYVNGAYVKFSIGVAGVNALILASMKQFIGAQIDFCGIEADIPTFWLPSFGQSLLRAGQYAPLFAKIGTTYGAVDGTHFNVPDDRGRVSAGKDNMGGTSANRLTNPATTVGGLDGDILGNTGGEEAHTQTILQLAIHDHDVQRGSGAGAVARLQANAAFSAVVNQPGAAINNGSSQAANVVQPTIIKNKIIYAGA